MRMNISVSFVRKIHTNHYELNVFPRSSQHFYTPSPSSIYL
uniref:Uncharacterized protein n=1 Tax=Lepeophtheirus salmonis TaxID=72036 RepID=A0A0K2TCT0_LEPSM